MGSYRRSEATLFVYFAYVIILAWLRPVEPLVKISIGALNLSLFLVLAMLAQAGRSAGLNPARIIRDWLPAPLIILAYKEMGWLALPHSGIDNELSWVYWDRLVLGQWGLKGAIEMLGPVLPSILEVSYSLVYATVPFAMAMLYAKGRRERMDEFTFPILVAVLGTYALFPLFPSEPPRSVFPEELFPAYMTVFRKFNWWLLEGYGIHTSVFPSAHVSGAFAAAFAASHEIRAVLWPGRVLLAMAVLIAVATVYCRYHYLADAVAGLGMAVTGTGIARWIILRGAVRPDTASKL